MFRSIAVAIALLLGSQAAFAGQVSLTLNDIGVAGLEAMLDIARRSAPSMRDADMAVSLYNALQAAKQAATQADDKARKDLEGEVSRLADELAKAKAATGKGMPE